MNARHDVTIVATDPGDLTRPAVEALRKRGHVVHVLEAGLGADEAAEQSADADIILAGIVPLPGSAVACLRGVGLIVRCGSGVDSVDLAAASERGIWVANVPDYCVEEVADHAMLLLLAAGRHLTEFQRQLHERPWTELDYPPVRRFRGRTLGLVGFGRIGARVAARARAFGLDILVCDPHASTDAIRESGASSVDLPTLLARSDAISLHCPLTPATDHLLDVRAFRQMRRGVIIVNTSRGGLIDLDALDAAMDEGIVAAAGLDVIDGEPFPDLAHRLFNRRNVMVTPHVAFYSVDAQVDLGARVVDAVERYLAGEAPTALVNPQARPLGGR